MTPQEAAKIAAEMCESRRNAAVTKPFEDLSTAFEESTFEVVRVPMPSITINASETISWKNHIMNRFLKKS